MILEIRNFILEEESYQVLSGHEESLDELIKSLLNETDPNTRAIAID